MKKFLTLLALLATVVHVHAVDPLTLVELQNLRASIKRAMIVNTILGMAFAVPTVWAHKKIKSLNQASHETKNQPNHKNKMRALNAAKYICGIISGFNLLSACLGPAVCYECSPHGHTGKVLMNNNKNFDDLRTKIRSLTYTPEHVPPYDTQRS